MSAGFGALFGVVLITLLSGWVARFALKFSSPEYFAVYLLAFWSFVGLSGNPPLKTIVSLALGLAFAAVGMDTISGSLRLTFGIEELLRGVSFLVAVIGLFGIGELLLRHGRRAALRRLECPHQSPCGDRDDRVDAAALGCAAAQQCNRLLDGHYAGRADGSVVHVLRHRQALFAATPHFGKGEPEGIDRPPRPPITPPAPAQSCPCWRWVFPVPRQRR